jgi:hypothetical protein
MCKNATKTAASLMAALEPTIKSLLTATGQLNTPNDIAAMNAYDAALAALENWQSGTPAQTVLELIAAFQSVFATLPIPANVEMFANIILGGITAVIGIVTANSPAPTGAEVHAETQAMHQADVAAATSAKVAALVPGFKRSIWHSPESQYNKVWNAAVDENPDFGIAKV